MDVEQIYGEALGVSHVAALEAISQAGVAHELATVRNAPLAKAKVPDTAATAHGWADSVSQLPG